MKTFQNGSIKNIIFFGLVSIIIVGVGAYIYVSTIPSEMEAIDSLLSPPQKPQVTPSSTPEKISQKQPMPTKQVPVAVRILTTDDQSHLNAYEENLVHRGENASTVMKYATLGDTPKLKYYDEQTVVYELQAQKIGTMMSIYDIDSLTEISSYNLVSQIEGSDYIISIGNTGNNSLVFYKKGAETFEKLQNSILSDSETYGKVETGMGLYDYDFSLNDQKKTLTASVYKPINDPDGKENPKIRTVEFVLP